MTIDEYFLYSMPDITNENKLIIPKVELKPFKAITNQPKLMVSELTKLFQYYGLDYIPINFGKVKDQGAFTEMVAKTPMFHYYPGVFKVLDAVYLEIHSLIWHLDNAPTLLHYISKKDINRIRYNLNVLADWCGTNDNYYNFIVRLRQLDVDLGYAENQISYITDGTSYAK